MEEFKALRKRLIIVAALLIIAITGTVLGIGGFWFGAGIFVLLVGGFLGQGFYIIPANPPTLAIPMVRGEFIESESEGDDILLDPGWGFVPFKGPLFLDIQKITGEEIAIRFTTKEVVPGDRSEVSAPVSIYFSVDRENPAQVFIVGGLEEVASRIKEQVDQFLRKWIVSPSKGPQNMDEARQMSDDAINEILENLLAYDVKRIHPEIPTEVIVGYFINHRALTPQEKRWEATLKNLPPEESEELKKAAQERFQLIQDMRGRGLTKGKLPLHPLAGLGVAIRRMVVGNMEPTDETKRAVAKVAAAKFFAEEQEILTKSVNKEAKSYAKIPGVANPIEETFLRRGITHKETKVDRFETSPELTEVFKVLGGKLLDGIVSAMSGDKTKKKKGGK